MARVPVIAVSMGDPGGIGPETLIKALHASPPLNARVHIYGSAAALHEAAQRAAIEPFWWNVRDPAWLDVAAAHRVVLISDDGPTPPRWIAEPTRSGGMASFRWAEFAIRAAQTPPDHPAHASAMCTGPISKEAWALAGHRYPGHTELLAARFHAKRVAMMFVGPRLRVVLVTTHIPLVHIRDVLTIGRVFDAIDLGHQACRELGIATPRLAVCGLNPHAGEGGLLGDEETRLIEPAIALARDQGIDARGPFPADTIFNAAVARDDKPPRYDLVVAMYHDQGLIPVKILFRDETVNVTLGLPVTRTSPDHGTAFDIAGRNAADHRSTRAALDHAAHAALRHARPSVAAQ